MAADKDAIIGRLYQALEEKDALNHAFLQYMALIKSGEISLDRVYVNVETGDFRVAPLGMTVAQLDAIAVAAESSPETNARALPLEEGASG